MARIEQIHQGAVLTLDQADFQALHESAGGKPEIIAHQDDGLNVPSVTMPKGGDQLVAFLTMPGMEPLFELVKDEQHLPIGRQDATATQDRQRIDQPQFSGKLRTRAP